MAEIRIVKGAAAVHPNGRFKVVRKGEIATIAEDEAAELVSLGVAVYTKEPVLKTPEPEPAKGNDIVPAKLAGPEADAPESLETPDGIPASLDADDLQKMSFADLKKLATDMGLAVNKLRSRQAIIQALAEEPVFDGQAAPEDEAPPAVEAEGPIV